MRNLMLFLLLALPLLADDARAQNGAINVVCAACRDPVEHPADYANFAFNQVFGETGWMTFEQADDFYVHNLDGDRVYVDIDFVMGGINLFGNTLPLWPENKVKITVALPNGTIVEFLRSVFMYPLPVPAPDGPGSDDDHVDNRIEDRQNAHCPYHRW